MSSQGVGGEKLPQHAELLGIRGPQQGNRAARMVPPRTPQEMEAAMRRLRTRNIATGLIIGAFIVGVYSYTFRAISQETFLDELEGEAAALRAKAAQTSGTDRAPDGNAEG